MNSRIVAIALSYSVERSHRFPMTYAKQSYPEFPESCFVLETLPAQANGSADTSRVCNAESNASAASCDNDRRNVIAGVALCIGKFKEEYYFVGTSRDKSPRRLGRSAQSMDCFESRRRQLSLSQEDPELIHDRFQPFPRHQQYLIKMIRIFSYHYLAPKSIILRIVRTMTLASSHAPYFSRRKTTESFVNWTVSGLCSVLLEQLNGIWLRRGFGPSQFSLSPQ